MPTSPRIVLTTVLLYGMFVLMAVAPWALEPIAEIILPSGATASFIFNLIFPLTYAEKFDTPFDTPVFYFLLNYNHAARK